MPFKFYDFTVIIEEEEDNSGFYAYSPDLPGCYSNGRTVEETQRNMREAIQQHLTVLLERDEPVPHQDRRFFVQQVSIGVPA